MTNRRIASLSRAVGWTLTLTLLTACGGLPADHAGGIEVAWRVTDSLASPESAIGDSARGVIYVSNVNGYTRNGAGAIARVSIDGKLLEARWATGLNAPTGMVLHRDTLFVVDIDAVAAVDPESGAIIQRFAAPDSGLGLNDITALPSGARIVSASTAGALYRLSRTGLQLWVRDSLLRDANGLLPTDDGLLVAGWTLNRVDYSTGAVMPVEFMGLTDLETIAALGDGRYVISAIGARPLMLWDGRSEPEVLLERDVYSADLSYLPFAGVLVVPSGGDALVAYRWVP